MGGNGQLRDGVSGARLVPRTEPRAGAGREGTAEGNAIERTVLGRGSAFLGELPVLLLVAFAGALVVRVFLVQAFFIPTGSMEPTLQVGDRIVVNKLADDLGDIERGEIVVFRAAPSAPAPARDFVKRVIGVGGDRVRCCDGKGRVTVNGSALQEGYVCCDDLPSAVRFDVRTPEGALWVMGDHRSRSLDSRAHIGDPGGGFVAVDDVIGQAVAVAWPTDRWAMLDGAPAVEPAGGRGPAQEGGTRGG
ncbi:MAG: signal peptidase I [Carbonactinosporaceae bacterium]